MNGSRTDYIILAAMGGLAVLVVTLLALSSRPTDREGFMPVRSTHAARRSGTKAFYELSRRLDFRIDRLQKPLLSRHLEGQDVLFVINPLIQLRGMEVSALDEWVSDGGVLVCAGSEAQDLHGIGNTRAGDGPNGGTDEGPGTKVPKDDRALPLARGVEKIYLSSGATLELPEQESGGSRQGAEPLFRDTAGVRIAARFHGRGTIIVLSDSSFLANGRIGKADNAILAVNLASYALSLADGRRAAFDEYHFGYGKRASGWGVILWMIVTTSPGWAVLAVTLAAVLYLVRAGRRFGPRRAPDRSTTRTKLDHVRAVGGTLHAGGAHRLTLELVFDWFRTELAGRLGLPADAGPGPLAEGIARRTNMSEERVRSTLEECRERIEGGGVSERKLNSLWSRLADIEREIISEYQ